MTYCDEFEKRDDRDILRQRQLDQDYRFREATEVDLAARRERQREIEAMYPHLAGSAENIRNMQRALIESTIESIEEELMKLQQEAERLDHPEWTFSDAVEDFAKRFIDWVNSSQKEKL